MVDEHLKKRALKITDIAEMIYLADGVLWAARVPFFYNENGVRLHGDAINEQSEKDKASGIDDLVENYLCSFPDLNEPVDLTPVEILEKLSPLKSRILGMFRNGEVSVEYMLGDLYADPTVPDEWLLDLFAMRVKDKIISFVLQETAAKRASEKGDK